jgi:hypothetical protein
MPNSFFTQALVRIECECLDCKTGFQASGDVLSGLIAGLVERGAPLENATMWASRCMRAPAQGSQNALAHWAASRARFRTKCRRSWLH